MSDEQASHDPVSGGQSADAQPGIGSGGTAGSSQDGLTATLQLWVRAAGWLAMSLGGFAVLAALKVRLPFLGMVGLVMIGVATVLAGQALSEGFAWPIPICLITLAGLFGPWAVLTAVISGFYLGSRSSGGTGIFKQGPGPNAQLAYGLWVGGLGLIMLASLGRCC